VGINYSVERQKANLYKDEIAEIPEEEDMITIELGKGSK
jgi:hypothetical protein